MSLTIGTAGRSDRGTAQRPLLDEAEFEPVRFGSVARNESWPPGMPIRSDLDLLVLVRRELAEAERERLVDATLPLFLESGRQISPQFRTPAQHAASPSRTSIDADAVQIWPEGA